MRRDVVLAALLLPLSGCYAPQPAGYAQPAAYPPGYQYAQPGYQQPGYPQPGYPQPGYDPSGEAYPGYSENGGDPTLLVEGATVPLILYGGGWGYWDSRHSWHHAPDEVSRHLERERAGGFHRGGEGFGQQRPEGRPPGGAPNGGQNFFMPTTRGVRRPLAPRMAARTLSMPTTRRVRRPLAPRVAARTFSMPISKRIRLLGPRRHLGRHPPTRNMSAAAIARLVRGVDSGGGRLLRFQPTGHAARSRSGRSIAAAVSAALTR